MLFGLSGLEISTLIVTDIVLCGVGYLVFRAWYRREMTPPVWFVSLMMLGVFVGYGLVARYLWVQADERGAFRVPAEARPSFHPHMESTALMAARGAVIANDTGPLDKPGHQPARMPAVLLFCLAFWTVPVGYYSSVWLRSVAVWWVERRSWMAMPVETPEWSEDDPTYESARALAFESPIPFVSDSQATFSPKRASGHFAVVRRLEAEGKYADAAALLEQLSGQAAAIEPIWAEAMFRLALINEKCLSNRDEAIRCYQQAAMRCPDTEYGQLAAVALERLRPDGQELLEVLDAAFEYTDDQDSEDTSQIHDAEQESFA